MRIGEYELQSPLINSGGVVRTLEDVKKLAQTGTGAVLAGSYTLESRQGASPNGEVVYYHDPKTRITYNSLDMPNKGLVNVVDEIPEMIEITHFYNLPFILNLATVSDDPEQEIEDMFAVMIEAGIEELDGFELNPSCPNVRSDGGGHQKLLSYYPQQLETVLERVNDISRTYFRIGTTIVKISPFRDLRNATDLGMMFKRTEVDAVSAFNSFPGGIPLDRNGDKILEVPGGVGGMSGPGMTHDAEMQTMWLDVTRHRQGGRYEIIGSVGIHNAETIRRRLRLGAGAVSGTTMFFESNSWPNTINGHLSDLADLGL